MTTVNAKEGKRLLWMIFVFRFEEFTDSDRLDGRQWNGTVLVETSLIITDHCVDQTVGLFLVFKPSHG